jgi:hypothetical protein
MEHFQGCIFQLKSGILADKTTVSGPKRSKTQAAVFTNTARCKIFKLFIAFNLLGG